MLSFLAERLPHIISDVFPHFFLDTFDEGTVNTVLQQLVPFFLFILRKVLNSSESLFELLQLNAAYFDSKHWFHFEFLREIKTNAVHRHLQFFVG